MNQKRFTRQKEAYLCAALAAGSEVSFQAGHLTAGASGTRSFDSPDNQRTWVVTLPATVVELENDIKQGIAAAAQGEKDTLSLQNPIVALAPIQMVADNLNAMMSGFGWVAEPFFHRGQLAAGIRILPPGIGDPDGPLEVPLFQVLPDEAEEYLSGIRAVQLPACLRHSNASVIQLVAYQFARAKLKKKPAPATLSQLSRRVNQDIESLDDYGICPALAGILLHGNAPLLLQAELDNALEAHREELERDGILAVGAFHFPARANLKPVPADAFHLSVQPVGDGFEAFWSLLPPAATLRNRAVLFDLKMDYYSDDVPQYLKAVYNRTWYNNDNQLVDAPIEDAVRIVWRGLLQNFEPQMAAVKTVDAAIKKLGADGVVELVMALDKLKAARSFQRSTHPELNPSGPALEERWAAAADSADRLKSSLSVLKTLPKVQGI